MSVPKTFGCICRKRKVIHLLHLQNIREQKMVVNFTLQSLNSFQICLVSKENLQLHAALLQWWERCNRTLCLSVWCMLSTANIPYWYWGEVFVWVRHEKRNKLYFKSTKSTFMGYCGDSDMAYKIWLPIKFENLPHDALWKAEIVISW